LFGQDRFSNRFLKRAVMSVQIHPTACVDEGAVVGTGTRIWHFSHIAAGAKIGVNCTLGQNVFVSDKVTVGNHVKIQNNVSLYTGVELEDYVFCGPSCVFTNVINPRSEIVRRDQYRATRVQYGVTIGANATIICGVTLGRFALVAAGAVVTSDVPQYALMVGTPARRCGWISRHGHRLDESDGPGGWTCPESGWHYALRGEEELVCLDWPEDKRLPVNDDS
jgi:UDP-2-acetamido-3-amino-2,3-dideoxy-glucuronate N-acetyltransferase